MTGGPPSDRSPPPAARAVLTRRGDASDRRRGLPRARAGRRRSSRTQEAGALLLEAGAESQDGRLHHPRARSCAPRSTTAPPASRVYDRDGRPAHGPGRATRVHFDPGSAAIHILDAAAGGAGARPLSSDIVRACPARGRAAELRRAVDRARRRRTFPRGRRPLSRSTSRCVTAASPSSPGPSAGTASRRCARCSSRSAAARRDLRARPARHLRLLPEPAAASGAI